VSIFELPRDPSYQDLQRFTQNILDAAHQGVATPGINLLPSREAVALYYASLAQVCLVEKLDGSLEQLRLRMFEAAQHVGAVSETGTRLLIEATNAAAASSKQQTAMMARQNRQLVIATWVLAVATLGLLGATVALYFKP
jgi:hypothetical protein